MIGLSVLAAVIVYQLWNFMWSGRVKSYAATGRRERNGKVV
jgi:hypothetical protein